MANSPRKSVIDFTRYITERTENFAGREWVFRAINDWLANPDGARFFLLKGEPGSGKTAISARLSQFADGAISPPDGLAHLHTNFLSAMHFCSARDSRWINPRVFAESLALQLAKRYPVYNEELMEKSGDRSIRIEVHQQIGQGSGVGVLIKMLDVSGAPPEDAFNRVVREPLEALVGKALEGQVIILVDALDEALSSTITPNIVSLLSQTDNLPSRVRFILTTRQESRVENKFRNVNDLSLSIPYDQRNQLDIRRYVQGRLHVDLQLAAKAEQVEPAQITQLIEVVPQKAEGNFLYARFLLDAMAKGLLSLSEMDGLPTGLDELYFDSLNRVVELGKRDWFTEYRPLIGVLSVAQESLTLAQLQAFTAQPESVIWQSLSDLQQFIQETSPQDGQAAQETSYRLYHQSVSDFLGRKRIGREQKQSLNDYYIPSDEWHKKLVDICEQGDLSLIWNDIKRNAVEQSRREYARRYYITHLYLAQDWQKLFEVLDTTQYGQSKIQDDPSTRSYALDLDLGRQAAIWDGWTLEEGIALLPRLWQYTLVRCSLTSRADQYPEEAFRLLVLLGRKQEALWLAELRTDPAMKVRVLLHIAEQLREQASPEFERLEILMSACEIARTLTDSSKQAEALIALGSAFAQAGQEEHASQVWTQAEHVIDTIADSSDQAAASIALITAFAQAGQEEHASQVWAQAERIIGTLTDSMRQTAALTDVEFDSSWHDGALSALGSALITALAQAGQWARAEHVIDTLTNSSDQARLLSELGRALAHAGQEEHASRVWAQAEHVIGTLNDSFWKDSALRELGSAFAHAGQWARAERVFATITDSSKQAEALIALSSAFAHAGQEEHAIQVCTQAEHVIDTIADSSDQARLLNELGSAFAQAGQWAQAEHVIDTITDSSGEAKGLIALGRALAHAGQEEHASRVWAQAERIIGTLTDSIPQAEALIALITALAHAGQEEHASRVWAQAERIIGTLNDSSGEAKGLIALGSALACAGKEEHASRVWARAERVIGTITDSDEQAEALSELEFDIFEKDGALNALRRALIIALAQAGQWAQAEHVIDTITDSSKQAEALIALGSAFAHAGQEEHASRVWAQAEHVIGTLNASFWKDRALSELGSAFAHAGQWVQAERVIGTITDSSKQAEALIALGSAFAHAGHEEHASRVWVQAEHVIGTIAYSSERARLLNEPEFDSSWGYAALSEPEFDSSGEAKALIALGSAFAQARQEEYAFQVWTQAEHVINTITASSEQAEALIALGSAFAHAGQEEHASWVWAQAEHVIGTLTDILWEFDTLSKLGSALATALTKAGQWVQAERVIGTITDSSKQAEALIALGSAFAHAGHEEHASRVWAQAEHVIGTIAYSSLKDRALSELGSAFAHAGQWAQAEHVINTITASSKQAEALRNQAIRMASAGEFEQLLHLIQRSWRQVEARKEAFTLFSLATVFISRKTEVGIAFFDTFTWVDTFLNVGN